MIGELSGDTADFLNEIPWFDGIIYIIMLMGLYVFYKWINKKFRQVKEITVEMSGSNNSYGFGAGCINSISNFCWLETIEEMVLNKKKGSGINQTPNFVKQKKLFYFYICGNYFR